MKVLDYGLAKALEGDTPSGTAPELSQSPTLTRHGTQIGVILGTAAYMSPEQAKGKRIDTRTDIFAFGGVLYEMLSGTTAFPGDDVSEVLAAVIKLEPDWRALPDGISPRVRELVERCLRKDRRQRLQHVGDARITLEEAPSEETRADQSDIKARHRLTNPYAAALVAAVLASGVTWFLGPSEAPQAKPVSRTVIPLPSDAELAMGPVPSVAISADGQSIAYAARRGGQTQLYLRRLAELEATSIEGTQGGGMPFFSPDGQWLAFVSQAGLSKVSLSGGAPIVLGALDAARGSGEWLADGSMVLTRRRLGSHGLTRTPSDGGEFITLTEVDADAREKTHRLVDVLPGGEAALFTIGDADIDTFDDAAIAALSLDSGKYRVLFEGGTNPYYVPSGHLVYARDGSLLAVPFDASSLELTGAPVTVLEGVMTSPIYGHAEFRISANGSLLYAPGGAWGSDYRVVLVDREGRSEPLIETPRAYSHFRLSPDRRTLALAIEGASIGLWLHDLDRGAQTRFLTGYNNHRPVWAPDGDRLAFMRQGGPESALHWKPVDGSGDAELLLAVEAVAFPSSWSPDGTMLTFHAFRGETGLDIFGLTMNEERAVTPVLQTEFDELEPMISPDGRWLAYQSNAPGRMEIYLQTFPDGGRTWQVSTEGGAQPVWNPNGRELFYRQGDTLMAVDIATDGELALGTPRALFEHSSPESAYDVGPDGERFIMIDASVSRAAPTELILVQNWTEELKRLVPTEN